MGGFTKNKVILQEFKKKASGHFQKETCLDPIAPALLYLPNQLKQKLNQRELYSNKNHLIKFLGKKNHNRTQAETQFSLNLSLAFFARPRCYLCPEIKGMSLG